MFKDKNKNKIEILKIKIKKNFNYKIMLNEENIVAKYLNFVANLKNIGHSIEEIKHLDDFKNFRSNNLINFSDAQEVDEILFGYSGSFWRSAYKYPRENDIFEISKKANNVGLLTFNISRIEDKMI